MSPYHEIGCLGNIHCVFMKRVTTCAVTQSCWIEISCMLTARHCNSLTTNAWNTHTFCSDVTVVMWPLLYYNNECTCSLPKFNFFTLMQLVWILIGSLFYDLPVNIAWQVETITHSWNTGYHSECPKICGKTIILLLFLDCLTAAKQFEFCTNESLSFGAIFQTLFCQKYWNAIAWWWADQNCISLTFHVFGVQTVHCLPPALLLFTELVSWNSCTQHKTTLWDGTGPLLPIPKCHLNICCVCTTDSLLKNVSSSNMIQYRPLLHGDQMAWGSVPSAHSDSITTQTNPEKIASENHQFGLYCYIGFTEFMVHFTQWMVVVVIMIADAEQVSSNINASHLVLGDT